MNWKNGLILGIISGLVSGGICIMYSAIYYKASYTDFSAVISPVNMVVASVVGTLLMAIGYVLAGKIKNPVIYPVLNIIYSALSFASIISVLKTKLPMDVEFPELFTGLAIPMHFFPALSFLALVPFFMKLSQGNK